jgi:hypothetical protein
MSLPSVIIASATVVAGPERPPRPAWLSPGQARRLDPLASLVAAAVDGLPHAGLATDTAVVVGSAWGSVHSTLSFVDGMATWGDGGGSPAAFTTSVHHHPASSLSEILGLHGPVATISSGGTSGLAALRWAKLMLDQGRAPAVLMVAADLPSRWSRRIVEALSACPFTVGGGATALLITSGGVGRNIRAVTARKSSTPSLCVDAGGSTPAEEQLLLRRGGAGRRRAVDQHGHWWPTAALAAVPWSAPESILVREHGDGILLEMILDSPGSTAI